jgi:glycine oxidase
MDDVVIIGGGVIGLSMAWELAGEGLHVRVLERGEPGREASWAGAGILPPPSASIEPASLASLTEMSWRLHPIWHEQLRGLVGIDNGYRRTGGIYIAANGAEAERLHAEAAEWRRAGAAAEAMDAAELIRREAALAGGWAAAAPAALWVPDEAQLRNPWHLKALRAACQARGVRVCPGVSADGFLVRRGRVQSVETPLGPIAAGAVCIAGGAWSQAIASRLGVRLQIRPVRGQIVLLDTGEPLLGRIINVGRRYLVPRAEGRVLVGSTEEEAGFDNRTTAVGISGLLEFALGLVPRLEQARVETTWAGLRPASADGLPYLGAIPELQNAFVAAGHYRSGLLLSPATAVVMSRLIRGLPPEVDLAPFRIDR